MIKKEFLDTEITYLPGVGPKRAELLNKELNIFTFRDLLYYFPYKYIDRTRFYKIAELDPDLPFVQIRGIIKGYTTEGHGSGKRLVADFKAENGSREAIAREQSSLFLGNQVCLTELLILSILKLKLQIKLQKDLIPHCRRSIAPLKSLKISS